MPRVSLGTPSPDFELTDFGCSKLDERQHHHAGLRDHQSA
jgi:hypothetical protein